MNVLEVKEIRKKLNLSQAELAKKIKVTVSTVRSWEQGHRNIPDSTALLLQSISLETNGVEVQQMDNNSKINHSVEGRFPKKKGNDLIPFYDVDFVAGNSVAFFDDLSSDKPAYYMDVPEFYGCKAFRAYSDSMEPIISSGNILFATKVQEWNSHLEYGQIYGIVCNDGRKYLKYIKKYRENSDFFFLLESQNKHYDEFELPKEAIRSVWLIHGWLNKNT